MFWNLKDILETNEMNEMTQFDQVTTITTSVKSHVSNLFQYKPIQYIAAVMLYSFSMIFSFLCAGMFVTPLTFNEIQEDIEQDKLAAKRAEEQSK